MTEIRTSVRIQAPQATVFEVFTDIPGSAERISAITQVELLTDGLTGVGTRWRETRVLYGRTATEVLTIAAYDPPRSYTVTAESHGARYETRFTFTSADPAAAGLGGPATDVEMVFSAIPLTRTAKLLAFLTRPMIRAMAKLCAKDLEELKTAIEARQGVTASQGASA